MKLSFKRLAAFLADPKSVIFGIAVFTFMWAWLVSPEYHFHRNIYMASCLLAASILILLNKLWSNLVAAIIGGYLPFEALREFWMFPMNAEVPMLSSNHFSYFFANIESGVMIFILLALLVLTRSVFAIIHQGRTVWTC